MMNRPSVPDALTAEPSRLFSGGFFKQCVSGWLEQCCTACICCSVIVKRQFLLGRRPTYELFT